MSNPNNEILDLKSCYSKTLKAIDAKIKFQQDEEDYFDNLKKDYLLKKREKQLKFIKNQQHENIVRNLKRLEEETRKEMNSKFKNISLSSAINRIISLPKMNKYKNDIKDNKKGDEYNIIKFESVWKEQYMNDIKYNKKRNKNKIMFGGIYYTDIFDKNYDKYRKHLEESKEKNMRLERVKINNLKVSRKLNIHRQIMLRFQDQREYRPNYSVIEKHQPTVKLDSKSTRLFLRHINPVTIPSIKSYNSRNNKNKKNDFKKKVISSLSELKIASNSKNILAKSQQDIIGSNEKEIGKRKVSLSTLNIKPKKFNTLIKDSYTNKKNCFITQRSKMYQKKKNNASTLDLDTHDLKLKL